MWYKFQMHMRLMSMTVIRCVPNHGPGGAGLFESFLRTTEGSKMGMPMPTVNQIDSTALKSQYTLKFPFQNDQLLGPDPVGAAVASAFGGAPFASCRMSLFDVISISVKLLKECC